MQDFYAHSNWVELGAQGLVDASLTAWPVLPAYGAVGASGVVVVEGEPPSPFEVRRPRKRAYPDNAVAGRAAPLFERTLSA